MLIKVKRKLRHPDAPQRHNNHGRPMTRRELLGQGFIAGSATVLSGGILGLFANPRSAYAALAADLQALTAGCGITNGAGKIPFIAFDLAGGANMSGSNVLVGREQGQLDVLSTAGYRKLGLPGDQVPGVPETTPTATSNGDHTDTSLGLGFHSDSAFLRGILSKTSPTTRANVNGAVLCAQSENDTDNNPHNPMYGINKAGANGSLVTLIGTEPSESGGNSVAPMSMIDPTARPVKIEQPSDATGLVDTGKLVQLLDQDDAAAVMRAMERITELKLAKMSEQAIVEELIRCGFLESSQLVATFGNPALLNPLGDPDIAGGPAAIFTDAELQQSEFEKTAAVMKLVVNGFAGAGTIELGGYDYHDSTRATGAPCRAARRVRCSSS